MGVVRVVDNHNMESLTELRVRYAETDAMGIVHHATYPVWMELGAVISCGNSGKAMQIGRPGACAWW